MSKAAEKFTNCMDNASIVCSFIESVIASKSVLLANAELRIEPAGHSLQLWAKREGMVSSALPTGRRPRVTVKESSRHSELLHETLLDHHFLPTQTAPVGGFHQYESASIPQGYTVHYKEALMLLQAWWRYQYQEVQEGALGMLLWHNQTWHPIRAIECERGLLNVSTWGDEILLQPACQVVWLVKKKQPAVVAVTPKPEQKMEAGLAPSSAKCMGNYLMEAGLLSAAQVGLVLSDQVATGMRFGDIVASRGWLKAQTIEYLMTHLIAPQQTALARHPSKAEQHLLEPRAQRKVEQRVQSSVHDRETLIVAMPFDDGTKN